MHPANQRLGKSDKLSQGVHNQTSYPRVQWQNTLDKRGLQNPRGKQEERRREGNTVSCEPGRGECEVKEQEQEHRTTHAAGS